MSSILRMSDVVKKVGMCKASIYGLIREGRFPKQIKLSKRASGWLDSDVQNWLDDRVAERDSGLV